jgi:tetratricopeptide (TPR) repeat protein
MKTPDVWLSLQESILGDAIALLEAGRPLGAIEELEQLDATVGEQSFLGGLPVLSLARSIQAHALADLNQGQHAFACLEEALSLTDPVDWLMERLWRWLAGSQPGKADEDLPLPVHSPLQVLFDLLPAEASHPVVLCGKAEGLYVHHEFEAATSLLGLASLCDAWSGRHAFTREFYLSNSALAAYKAGDADLALSLSAAAVERLEAGSQLAATLCYNRAALLWDQGLREQAEGLYRRSQACDASDGRACLAQSLAAEQLAVQPPLPCGAERVARLRATHASLYDAPGWEYDGEGDRPRIWIPLFAGWRGPEAKQVE